MVKMDDINDDFADPDDEPLPPPPLNSNSTKSTKPTTIPLKDRHKSWTTLYPFYLDSKQPHKSGFRRVNKVIALNWPIAEGMARGCLGLGLEVVFEQEKTHPKDWANPGRVKVLIKTPEGIYPNPQIRSKQVLLEKLCQLLKPFQPKDDFPSIELRYPPNSPAVSFGQYEAALLGKGPAGMFGGMGGAEGTEEKKEEEIKPVAKGIPKVKKLHIKRR